MRRIGKEAILVIVLLASVVIPATVFAQTNLTVVRHTDNTLWAMICDGINICSAWTQITGKFSVQPTLTWDQMLNKYILIGIGNNQTSIWRSTFNEDGSFNNDWTLITGASPSPVAVSGAYYDTLGELNSCSIGQIPKWNGGAWVCAADDVSTGATPSSTVANLDGVSSPGASVNYSRGDHKHGIAVGSITSSHIQDGTILDIDISPSAAISFSKLSGVASATHNHDAVYVNVTGDTMTGALNLPADGLAAGTNQLVLSGGNVGIGTTSPTQKLEVSGNVKISGTGNNLAFPDGTTQTTAVSGGGGGVPSGFMILGDTSTAPAGYMYTGLTIDMPGSWVAKGDCGSGSE